MNSKKHLVSESRKPHAKSRDSELRFEPGQKDLTQALEWQRAIFEGSGDAVFVSTTGWKLVEVNAAACELTGYTRTELLNLRITDLLAEEDGKPFRKNRDRFAEGETVVSEATILRQDQGVAVVEFNLRRIVVANKPYVHAVARDITARKQNEERLRQREACYRSFFEEDLTGDFISTPSGELLACNKTFARILGFDSVEEALKTNMYSLYAQEKDRDAYLKLLNEKKKIENYERELIKKDKKKISVIANVSGQFDENGRLVEIRGTIFDVTDSKRAAAALQQSEERYRVAFQTSPDAVTINRLKDGVYVEINEGFTAITGYSKEDVMGKSSLELGIWHNPKDRERLVARLRQGGQVENFEAEFRFKDGTISTGLMSAKVITFDGEPHILSMTRDISELKQAETALKKSELRYRALVEYMNEGLMQVDNHGVIQFVNDRFCNMVGYGPQELLGKVASDLFLLQEDKARMEERLRLRLQKVSEQYEIRMKKKSGETIWVRISGTPVVDENKQVIGSIGIHTDITNGKRIEDALNVQKAYFQQLFENSPEAIVLLDNADRVVNANQGFERLFQYRLEEIKNRCINEIIVPTDMTKEASSLSRAVLNKKVVQTESVRKRKDGSLVDVSVLGYPIELSEQQIGVYGIYYDITERKQAEKAMRLRFEQLETIYTLSDAVSRAEEIEEIYLKALNALESSLKADRSSILIFDADGVGRFKAWRGLSAQYRKVVEGHLPWSREETNPQPVLVPNVEEEAGLDEFRNTILQEGIRALAFIPLKYQGRLLGKFMIYYNTDHQFSQEEIQLAQTIASHIAFALERKRTLKSLSESELRYRELVERMPDGIYRSTPEGRFLAVNSALVKMLGYESQEELLKVDIPRDLYFSPDEREALFKSIKEGKNESIVFRLKKKDNSELWVEDHGHRVYDSQGKSLYYEGVLRDISERKRAEEALRNIAEGVSAATGEAFFRSLVQYLARALDADYAFIGELTGECADCIQTIAVCAHGEIVDNFQYNLRHTPCENVVKKQLCSYPTGVRQLFPRDQLLAEMNVESYVGTPLVDFNGRTLGVVVVLNCQPLHNAKLVESMLRIFAARASAELERKFAERTLRESEARFRDLFDHAPDIYIILDPNGRVIDFNQSGQKQLGYPKEEILGKSITNFIHPEDLDKAGSVMTYVHKKQKPPKNIEVRLLCKDGSIMWVSKEFSLLKTEDGKLQAIRVACRDITEHLRLMEELARAQRLQTAGQVAGQIAHDFNNLLAPLTAYPALIREDLPEGNPAMDMVDDIESAARKIAEINQQLLALGRRGHYVRDSIDLNDLLQKLLMSNPLPPEIVVEEDFDFDLLPIQGGVAQLTRAFTNLLNNAKEAMQAIGVLTIRTRNVYLDEPLKGYQTIERGEYVRLEISDTGTGIDPAILDNIFDPFFTTKKMDRMRGSGLGLSIVHGIIEDHKGYISVESTLGKGATFTLYFPVAREVEKEVEEALEISRGGDEKILVIDDDPVQRRVTAQLLKRLGYQVHTVPSGENAVAYLRNNPQDLLLLDMVMDGIDGVETYRRILEFQPKQKAIILSGYAMSQRVQEALRLGAGSFISKPVTLNDLADSVRKELDKE